MELLKNHLVAQTVKELGTFDVGIVDHAWAWKCFFDEDRRMTKAQALKNNQLEKIYFFLQECYENGHIFEMNDNPVTLS